MKSNDKNIDKIFNKLINLTYEEFVDYLLSNRFNIEKQNCQGETLLHLCCLHGFIEKFYTLVYMGAKTDITNKQGHNILHYSCMGSRDLYLTQEIAKKYISVLMVDYEGNTPMHYCDNEKDIIYFYNWSQINKINLRNIVNHKGENIYDFAEKRKYKNTLLWKEIINE